MNEFDDDDGDGSAHNDNNVDENMDEDTFVNSKDGTTCTIISDGGINWKISKSECIYSKEWNKRPIHEQFQPLLTHFNCY